MHLKFVPSVVAAMVCSFAASTSQAALLTSFSDDFNQPDGQLGSNYTQTSASGTWYSISNSSVLNTHGGESLAYLNVGTLPTSTDFANGYSFTASIDLYVPTPTNVPAFGMLLNYQSNTNYAAIALRGAGTTIRYYDRTGGVQQVIVGPTLTVSDSTWYTLTVSASTAGAYAYTWAQQGSSTVLNSGTITTGTFATFTGGNIGFFNDSTPSGGDAYRWDNLSVTVVPEPTTLALCATGVGMVFLARRRFRPRSR